MNMNMNDDITILDLFAIHAPKDIPEWFIPVMEQKPLFKPLPDTFQDMDFLKYYNSKTESWEDPENRVPYEFKKYVRSYINDQKRKYEFKFQETHKIERIIQWPYHYAKLMIEKRELAMKSMSSSIPEKEWPYGCTPSIEFPLPIHSIRMTGQSEPVKLFFTSCDTLTELAAVLTQYSNWTFSVENTRLMANSQEGIEISINEGEVTMSLQEMVPY